jgi:ketosteroid isomerase-like protein
MKPLFAVAAATVLFTASAAWANDAAVEAPIHQMEAAFNKGDIAAAKATHVAAPTIVDNLAPFAWTGPAAFDSWVGDLVKSEAALGKSGGAVWFGDAVQELVSGDVAYVVVPCTYTFKQKGQTLRETGLATFGLVREAGGWKIRSWTWASPTATPLS